MCALKIQISVRFMNTSPVHLMFKKPQPVLNRNVICTCPLEVLHALITTTYTRQSIPHLMMSSERRNLSRGMCVVSPALFLLTPPTSQNTRVSFVFAPPRVVDVDSATLVISAEHKVNLHRYPHQLHKVQDHRGANCLADCVIDCSAVQMYNDSSQQGADS